MPLHIGYRPDNFEEVLGNKQTVDSLRQILSREKETIPHAFLLSGPSGCGKTTLARIIRTKLKCSDHDYKEVDAADFRGIDTIREIRRQMNLKPVAGNCRVWRLPDQLPDLRGAQGARPRPRVGGGQPLERWGGQLGAGQPGASLERQDGDACSPCRWPGGGARWIN